MILQHLINFMFPESIAVANAVLYYSGMRTLFVYHQLGDIQISDRMECDLGEEPWTFLVQYDTEIIEHLRAEFGMLSVDLEFNALNLSLVAKGTKEVVAMFFGGTAPKKPNWDIDDGCYIELAPEEWMQVQRAASIVGESKHKIYEGVSFALSGTLLEVSASRLRHKNSGLMVSMLFNLPFGLDDDHIGLNAIIPAEAIKLVYDEKLPVTIEINASHVCLVQGTKAVYSPLINGDYPPIGLIPDGEIKAEIDFQKLKAFASRAKLRSDEALDKIVITADITTDTLTMSAFDRKAGVFHDASFPVAVYKSDDEYDGPKIVICHLAQSALMQAVKLIGSSRKGTVTLSVPIGMQAMTMLAGSTRIVLPAIVHEAIDLGWDDIRQLEPIIKGKSFTEVQIGEANHPRFVEARMEKIESTPADDLLDEPSSVDEAVGQLQRALTKGRKALEKIYAEASVETLDGYNGLETESVEILQKAVRFGTGFTNIIRREQKSPWDDPMDIHRITRSIVLSIARAESFMRKTQAWENRVTFTFVDK